MTLELFNLSYSIAFLMLTIALRQREREAYARLMSMLEERLDLAGDHAARLIKVDHAHTEWTRRVGRLEVAYGLLFCELLGLAIWGAWTSAQTLWGAL